MTATRQTYLEAINSRAETYFWFNVVGSSADIWFTYLMLYMITNSYAMKSASAAPLQDYPNNITIFLVELENRSDGTVALLRYRVY